MARNIINSMAIDADGEDYSYINASMAGASDLIDRTANMLSAVTDIPQTILFGNDYLILVVNEEIKIYHSYIGE